MNTVPVPIYEPIEPGGTVKITSPAWVLFFQNLLAAVAAPQQASTALQNHQAAVIAHGTTSAIMGVSDAQVVTNKNLSSPSNLLPPISLSDLSDVVLTPIISAGYTFSPLTKVFTLPAGETSAGRIVYCGVGKFVCATEGTAKVFTSSDNGATWTSQGRIGGTTTETSIYGLIHLGSGVVLAGTYPNGKLYRNTAFGVGTWTEITAGYTDAGKSDLRGFASNTDGSVVLMGNTNPSAAGQSGKIWASTNQGVTWIQVYDGSLTADYYQVTQIIKVSASGGYLALATPASLGPKMDSKVLQSAWGTGWAVVATIQATNPLTMATDGLGTVLIGCAGSGTSSNHIYRSTDSGMTFTDLGQLIPGVSIHNGLKYIGGTTWIVGTNGSGTANCAAWVSTNNGTSWALLQSLVDVAGDATVYTFALSDAGVLVAGTFSVTGGVGKIWKGTVVSGSRQDGAKLQWDTTAGKWVDGLPTPPPGRYALRVDTAGVASWEVI